MSRQERGLLLKEMVQFAFWGAAAEDGCALLGEPPGRGSDSHKALAAKQEAPGTAAITSSGEGGSGTGDSTGKALRSNILRRTSPKSQVSKHMP